MAHRPFRSRACEGDRLATTLLAALLLAVAVERGVAIVAGVALVPFLLALRGTRGGEAARLGFAFGVAYALLLAHWIPAALEALGSSRASAWAGFAFAAVWVGPPVFLLVAGVERAFRTQPTARRALALGASVFAAEWALGHAWWGVPWGLVGHSQRDALGVAQLAVVGGIPAISMLLVATNTAIADALRGCRGAGWLAAGCVAAWLALALGGLPVAEAARSDASASKPLAWLVVQPDLPRGERWAPELQALNLHRVREAVARARAAHPEPVDAIALPENLLTVPLDTHPELGRAVAGWVDDLGVPVLAGFVFSASTGASDRYRSAAVWIEPERGITARLDKERAIPILESGRSHPGARRLAMLFGGAASWRKVEETHAATDFAGPISVAPLLCYEALFPAIAARRRGRANAVLVNLADTGWLPSAAARRRLAGLVRFRAIEARAPLLRVALGGPSLFFDPLGREVAIHSGVGEGALRIAVTPSPPPGAGERAALLALPLLAFTTVASLCRGGAALRGLAYLRPPLEAGVAPQGRAPPRPPESRRTECDVSKTGPY